VVVIALTAEGISAAFHATVGTDRRSAVSTFSHSGFAARRPYVLSLDTYSICNKGCMGSGLLNYFA
jgi:hypothetical protein